MVHNTYQYFFTNVNKPNARFVMHSIQIHNVSSKHDKPKKEKFYTLFKVMDSRTHHTSQLIRNSFRFTATTFHNLPQQGAKFT